MGFIPNSIPYQIQNYFLIRFFGPIVGLFEVVGGYSCLMIISCSEALSCFYLVVEVVFSFIQQYRTFRLRSMLMEGQTTYRHVSMIYHLILMVLMVQDDALRY